MRQSRETQVFNNNRNRARLGTAFALLAGLAAGRPVRAQGPDGRAILEKTLRAYHDLSSYDGQTSFDQDIVAGAKGQKKALGSSTSVLKFKRPNKLQIKLTSAQGTLEVYNDGNRLVTYRPGVQKYTVAPSVPDMNAMQAALVKQAGILGVFDPLYFLCNTSLPPALSNFKAKGSGSVDGHPVYIVTASFKPAPVQRVSNPFIQLPGNWTFYIDKSTNLLQKVEAQVPTNIKGTQMKDKKKVEISLNGAFEMRHTIIDAKPNVPVEDSQFVFTPPKGATEQKDANTLLQGHGAGK